MDNIKEEKDNKRQEKFEKYQIKLFKDLSYIRDKTDSTCFGDFELRNCMGNAVDMILFLAGFSEIETNVCYDLGCLSLSQIADKYGITKSKSKRIVDRTVKKLKKLQKTVSVFAQKAKRKCTI